MGRERTHFSGTITQSQAKCPNVKYILDDGAFLPPLRETTLNDKIEKQIGEIEHSIVDSPC